jgi:hypothetical protein
MKSSEALKLVGGLSPNLQRCLAGHMVYQLRNAKQVRSSRTWKAAPVMVVTLSKAAMYLKLCRKHNTGAWRQHQTPVLGSRYGSPAAI